MELRLNKEGIQYVLGLPLKDKPALLSQVIFSAGELLTDEGGNAPEVIRNSVD